MSPARQWHFTLVLALMIVAAIVEIILIFSVLPFVAIMSGAPTPLLGSAIDPILSRLNDDPLIASAILLMGSWILMLAVRLALTRASWAFVMNFGHDLSMKIFDGMIQSSYQDYINGSSADLVARMARVADVTIGYVQPMMQALVGAILTVAIGVFLLVLNPFACLALGLGLGLVYYLLSKLTWPHLHANSIVVADSSAAAMRTVLTAHGGFRAIALQGAQSDFSSLYRQIDWRIRTTSKHNIMLTAIPSHIVQVAALFLLTLVTIQLSQGEGGLVAALPILGALTIGIKRMLPHADSAWQNCSIAIGNTHTVTDVVDYLRNTKKAKQGSTRFLPLRHSVQMENVAFDYDAVSPVLKDISLMIRRGQHIGICGETGSGKTTLLDVLLGLLKPICGSIFIDGQPLTDDNRTAWQRNIGHVPQDVYLVDDSIAANIAFGSGHSELDMEQVRIAAKLAQMDRFIDGLPLGLNSQVGERGIKLSGGQQQRLGLARALYGKPSVLVLDEATSALDSDTEARVMQSIVDLPDDLTIITVAHRLSTLQYCDQVFLLENGRLNASAEGTGGHIKEVAANGA